jgi:type IV secretion system protein TrbH
MKPSTLLPIFSIVLLMAGCTSTPSPYFTPKSSESVLQNKQISRALARDLVGKLKEHLGPGQATLKVQKDTSIFGEEFEQELRLAGYAFETTGNNPTLSYRVGKEENAIFVRLSTATVELSQLYACSPSGVSPAGPLSVLRIG